MSVLLRESSLGRLLNFFSNGRILPYPDWDIQTKVEAISGSEDASITSKTPDPSLLPTTATAQYKIVDWTGPDDPDMPKNWPSAVKAFVVTDVMLLNFSFYAASAIFTPSISGIEEAFHATTAEGTLGLSLFVIAYGIGPLIVR